MSKKIIAGLGVVAGLAVALAPVATFADAIQPSDQHTDQLVLTVLPSCTFGSASKGDSPYPGGITHDNSTGGYAADGDASTIVTRTATAWDVDGTGTDNYHSIDPDSDNDPATITEGYSAGEVTHLGSDVASTGYGVLDDEGGLNATNHDALANASYHTVHRSMLAGNTTDTFASTTMWVVCNNRGGYSVTATATPLTNGTVAENIPVAATYSATASGYNLKSITSTSAGTAMTIPTAAAVAPTSETIIATHAAVSNEAGDSLTVVYGLGVASSQKADTYAGTVTYKLYKGVNGANTGANTGA